MTRSLVQIQLTAPFLEKIKIKYYQKNFKHIKLLSLIHYSTYIFNNRKMGFIYSSLKVPDILLLTASIKSELIFSKSSSVKVSWIG